MKKQLSKKEKLRQNKRQFLRRLAFFSFPAIILFITSIVIYVNMVAPRIYDYADTTEYDFIYSHIEKRSKTNLLTKYVTTKEDIIITDTGEAIYFKTPADLNKIFQKIKQGSAVSIKYGRMQSSNFLNNEYDVTYEEITEIRIDDITVYEYSEYLNWRNDLRNGGLIMAMIMLILGFASSLLPFFYLRSWYRKK